jgi:hypothetical protein
MNTQNPARVPMQERMRHSDELIKKFKDQFDESLLFLMFQTMQSLLPLGDKTFPIATNNFVFESVEYSPYLKR